MPVLGTASSPRGADTWFLLKKICSVADFGAVDLAMAGFRRGRISSRVGPGQDLGRKTPRRRRIWSAVSS